MNNYISKIKAIHQAFQDGRIKRLENHEVHPDLPKGSRERYLYFFMSCTINFQRSSPALWQASYATWHDSETNFLFFPEQVVTKSFEEIQAAMTKHKLALQKNKHPTIWIKISETLNKYYENDPRKIMEECAYEIAKIIPMLQKEKKDIFPYLGGIKLSNYTMMVLNAYTDIKFKDMYNLSIVPDTHIINASAKLGVVNENAKPNEVEIAWKPILKEVNIPPHEMHSALWHWSREGYPEI